jgi:hypothetical protein
MSVSSKDDIFKMHGARTAVKLGMLHIEEQVKALELAVSDNTGLAFDLARTLIESVCKTIITERGSTFNNSDDLPRLFRTVTRTLPFLPLAVATNTAARRSLEQTLNGLNTAIQGICELRNTFGFASHGRDGPGPAMEDVQAVLAAQAADAIVGFLYRIHKQDLSRPRSLPLEYDDHLDFNEWIDEQNELVRIFTLEYKSSEVLFNVDPQAYHDLLAEYKRESEAAAAREESEVDT